MHNIRRSKQQTNMLLQLAGDANANRPRRINTSTDSISVLLLFLVSKNSCNSPFPEISPSLSIFKSTLPLPNPPHTICRRILKVGPLIMARHDMNTSLVYSHRGSPCWHHTIASCHWVHWGSRLPLSARSGHCGKSHTSQMTISPAGTNSVHTALSVCKSEFGYVFIIRISRQAVTREID